MSIEEGNKLIAEFMEFEYNRSVPGHGGVELMQLTINDCRYHSSWDWLMPVVEKIRLLWDDTKLDLQLLEEHSDASRIRDLRVWAERGSVWLAVVEFIKWYNSNK